MHDPRALRIRGDRTGNWRIVREERVAGPFATWDEADAERRRLSSDLTKREADPRASAGNVSHSGGTGAS